MDYLQKENLEVNVCGFAVTDECYKCFIYTTTLYKGWNTTESRSSTVLLEMHTNAHSAIGKC